MKLQVKEKEIQKQILDWLRLTKRFCWKNNTVGIYIQKTGHYIPNQSAGAPDIFVVICGQLIGIEVKSAIGKQSPDQVRWQGNLEAAGGIYVLARSLDDVMEFFRNNL